MFDGCLAHEPRLRGNAPSRVNHSTKFEQRCGRGASSELHSAVTGVILSGTEMRKPEWWSKMPRAG